MRISLIVPDEKEETGVSNYTRELFEQLKTKIDIEKLYFPNIRLSLPFFNFGIIFKNHPIRFPSYSGNIVHIPNFFYALPVLFKRPKRLIITLHDLIPSEYGTGSFLSGLTYKLCLRAVKKADRIIVDSENTKNDAIKYLNFPEGRIDIIPLGVNTKKFRQLKIKKEPYSILYVGTEMPRKNLGVLIKAFAVLKKKLPDAKFIKVGAAHCPGARKKLIMLADELGIGSSMQFKDYVDDIAAEYNKVSLFVFPSLYEGFGLPILEAMACGCPVICSDKTSLPEVGGNTVVYFDGNNAQDLADKMFKVLTGTKFKKSLIKKGLKRIKEFSWEKTAQKTIEAYKKLS